MSEELLSRRMGVQGGRRVRGRWWNDSNDQKNTSTFPRRSHAKDTPDGHYEKSSHQGGGNNAAEDKGNGVADKGRVVADESDKIDEGHTHITHIAVDTEGEVVADMRNITDFGCDVFQ